jgi:Na+-driven multidrug efflux pump
MGGLAGIFIKGIDRVVTAKFISLDTVTTLVLSGQVYLLASSLLNPITNTARPGLGQLFGKEDFTAAFLNYQRLFLLSTSAAIVMAASLWVVNGNFVKWWVGEVNYGGELLDLAFSLNLIIQAWLLPNRATLSAALILKPQALMALLEGVLNFILSILLSLYLGILGIVISTTIAALVTSFWYIPYLISKLFNQKIKVILLPQIYFIIKLSMCMFIIALFGRYISSYLYGITNIIFPFFITFLLGVTMLWILILDSSSKNDIINSIYIFLDRKFF